MPKENRSSNTENAPCPFCGGQVDPEGWLRGDGMRGPECESCGATAPNLALWNGAQPAQQHQGEPVALPARKAHKKGNSPMQNAKNSAWNACLDEIAKLGPLYTHSDPSEVERLREDLSKYIARANDFAAKMQGAQSEAGTLRAQLAERDALLDRVVDHAKFWHDHPYAEVVEGIARDYKALSASAEPSALPDPLGCNECTHAECGKFDGPRQLECRAMADNACARPGASS